MRRGAWRGSRTTPAGIDEDAQLPAPDRIERSVRFDHVSFTYPGTDRLVLDDVSIELPAGVVVAIVGENGAGKTTLVKLLCRMYAPTSGAIFVDDVDLAQISSQQWRERVAGAFQDFFRFEFHAMTTVGLGDEPRMDERPAVAAAVARAGADDVIERLAHGLDTQLGPTWDAGEEVSYGQWQKLALARGFMRADPLVLVLDEPTSALDAETEHALFERYATSARRGPGRGERRDHDPRLAPLLDGADGRPDRRHRGFAGRRDRVARRADDTPRPLRRAVRHPGRGLPVTGRQLAVRSATR